MVLERLVPFRKGIASWVLAAAIMTPLSGRAVDAPPAPPYYSVQLMGLSSEKAALEELGRHKEQPFVRAEQRDNFWLVRVGIYPQPEPARAERDAFRAKGIDSARVVKISRAVTWLLPDGSKMDATGQVSAAAPAPRPRRTEKAPVATAEPSAPTAAAAAAAAAAPGAAATKPEATPVVAPPAVAPAPPAEPPPLEAENVGGATNWSSTQVTLERLGYREGFPLEGSEGTRRLFFPLPAGVAVQRAWLTFDVDFGELLIPASGLQFKVNELSRRAIRRGEGGGGVLQRVEIPLTEHDLELDFVEVELPYSLFVNVDVCMSRKLVGAYAHLTPGSGLTVIAADGLPRTVRAAWSLLPREVTVAARLAELTPGEFQTLFQLATLLNRHGYKPRFEALTDAPTTAHIVVAPAERYAPGATDALAASANLRLVRSRGPQRPDGTREQRAFILVDSTRPLPAADMLALPWRQAASATLIDVATAESWPEPRNPDTVLRLKDLGFDDAERVFNFSTEWSIALPFGPMGHGVRPSRVILDVYGPRVSDIRGPTFVSAYYNDRLVYSAALKQQGAKETLDFELPRIQLRARNNLKIVAQRDEAADDCKLSQAAYPLSISPASVVETRVLNETPATFAELVPHQRVLELYLAKDALAAPERVVPMLVGLGEHFWPDVPPPELRLFEPGAEIAPTAPFFVVGDARWSPRAPVQFDQGRVRLRSNATGQELMLLDFAGNAPITVLQMAESGGHGGAWLRTTGGYANVPAKRTLFEDENVAFLGPRGVQAAMKVGSTRDYRVDYPDAKGWFSATGAWRTALFVIAWVIVLGLLIYLYRRTRQHREG
jgi:hypothetical protein